MVEVFHVSTLRLERSALLSGENLVIIFLSALADLRYLDSPNHLSPAPVTPPRDRGPFFKLLHSTVRNYVFNKVTMSQAVARSFLEYVVMNPIDLFQDPTVSDVLIDSHTKIQVIREGRLETAPGIYSEDSSLEDFAKQTIRAAGGRIDLAKPFAEVNLSGEFGQLRFHVILGGQCSTGTQVSIRRHPAKHLELEDLLRLRTITSEQLSLLKEIANSRKNFLITGSTGSGKTTLLRALLTSVSDCRIITIEDCPELKVTNAIELYTRAQNSEGFGEISLEMLVREALRMRPDRLAIGEARGKELAILLQAMNTGHSGVGFTLHANGIRQAITRMQALLALSGIEANIANAAISSSIDVVIELSATDRKILSIEKLVI